MILAGMILAGGLSRRMQGHDKALVQLKGRPLLGHVLARLEPQVSELAVNFNGAPDRLSGLRLPVCPDTLPGHPGPLAGVLTAMDWAAGLGAERVFTVATDTPFLPGDFVPRLLLAAEDCEGPVLAASRDGQGALRAHPTCGLWPVTLRGPLRRALDDGQRRMMGWAEAQGACLAEFAAPGIDPFFNVNTPEDLARAEALLAGV
ncbi:molybdenum cofactor guanylyltransferase [Pseudooceanicola antarcticus]|uniref:Molybdenum cofactor guanylyltransferase n=2 Tax=Pseudooceanicola antarcticus TaxID=1247613 RepID=A0A285IR33_9RHOB|nr:molybdenum cofactor guanylyltransferase MobA [Pseudooceanicola antarcticus]SNY50480.1 molybdenum cofactor guanylyltransferase [Pseudooceanicola antarcticus]